MSELWGYHALFDCKACERSYISNGDYLKKFSRELVDHIDMKAYGEPRLEHFATHDSDKAGYSLSQFIETSHIAGHFVDKNGDCYLDIFSCKPFDVEKARNFIKEYLKPTSIKVHYIER